MAPFDGSGGASGAGLASLTTHRRSLIAGDYLLPFARGLHTCIFSSSPSLSPFFFSHLSFSITVLHSFRFSRLLGSPFTPPNPSNISIRSLIRPRTTARCCTEKKNTKMRLLLASLSLVTAALAVPKPLTSGGHGVSIGIGTIPSRPMFLLFFSSPYTHSLRPHLPSPRLLTSVLRNSHCHRRREAEPRPPRRRRRAAGHVRPEPGSRRGGGHDSVPVQLGEPHRYAERGRAGVPASSGDGGRGDPQRAYPL